MFEIHGKKFIYDSNSLYCCKHKFKLRRAVVWLTEWHRFDTVVIAIILIGSICMASYDYNDPSNETAYNQNLETI